MPARWAIVVHGGAGRWDDADEADVLPGLRAAAEAARALLDAGGTALDAVEAAVVALEDNPLFNAGTGSVLNLDGEVEMDASVMHGPSLRAGAVGALRGVKNPVRVARRVMEETDHVLLAGEGAQRFARAFGFPAHDPVTEARREDYRKRLAELDARADARLPALRALLAQHPMLAPGTVGAVALDASGALAAATSTGGTTLKLPGRIGDTPIPGAGTYATGLGAASATGHGEVILRLLLTRHACELIAQGRDASAAALRTVDDAAALGGGVGLIAIDASGRIGLAHDTEAMPHAWADAADGEIVARMRDGRAPQDD